MEFKKIELVNVPKPHNHIVEIAKVKQIAAKELQIGDIVLFGFHLLKILEAKYYPNAERNQLGLVVENLATGEDSRMAFPINSIFHRVIEADIIVRAKDGSWEGYNHWKRLRRPILGEMTICEICQGDCAPITQEEIDRFEQEVVSGDTESGVLMNCYEPTRDVFLAYDGCEEPMRG